MGREALYEATGIQFMELNTIFQLYYLAKNKPELLENTTALLIPDLLGYFLTGEMTAEYSIASTTQLMNPRTKRWNTDIMNKLGIPADLFCDIKGSGDILGKVSEDLHAETGAAQVATVAGHDTACAVVAAPTKEKDFIYISCGTWSLLGTETNEPIISEKSLRYNITNEGGYGYTTRFLKNIIGLWIIQETRRQYRRDGKEYSYADLESFALAIFYVVEQQYETGQAIPVTGGQIMLK